MIFRGDPSARRATILFSVLAFAFAWAFWFVEPAFRTTDPLAARLFVMLGSYGPALAAVIVRALSRERFGTAPL